MKNFNINKFMAMTLTILMVLGMMPAMVVSAGDYRSQIGNVGVTRYFDAEGNDAGVNEDNFAVAITKSIAEVKGSTGDPIENEFEITIEVKTIATEEEIEKAADAAVSILIDISASLSADSYANELVAAKSFIEAFAASATGTDAKRYVSIVTFGASATVLGQSSGNNNSWIDVNTKAGLDDAISRVNGLNNKQLESGTYTQGALVLAKNLYNTANFTGSLKTALDTMPVKNKFVVCLTDGNPNTYRSSITQTNLNTLAAPTSGTGAPAETAAGVRAARPYVITAANDLKKVATIYSIAYNTVSATVNTVDGITASDWLGANIASNTANAFSADQDIQSLNIQFEKVLSSINYAVKPWQMTDPMADGILFGGTVDGQITSFDDGTLKWDLQKAVPDGLGEGNAARMVFTYTYVYRITLDNLTHDFSDYKETNKATSLTYKMSDNDSLQTVWFDIPTARAFEGGFPFTKTGSDKAGEGGLADFAFTLTEATDGWSAGAISGVGGAVSFANIPSGHIYILKETGPATEDYSINATEYTVTVKYGRVLIEDASNGDLVYDSFSNNNNFTHTNPSKRFPLVETTKTIVSIAGGDEAKLAGLYAEEGDTIWYKVTAENTGTLALENVTVTDNLGLLLLNGATENGAVEGPFDDVDGDPMDPKADSLAVGDSVDWYFKFVVAEGSKIDIVKNAAIVKAESENGDANDKDEADDIEIKRPVLGIEKTLVEDSEDIGHVFSDGEEAYFEVTITNSGIVAAKGVSLVDAISGGALADLMEAKLVAVNGATTDIDASILDSFDVPAEKDGIPGSITFGFTVEVKGQTNASRQQAIQDMLDWLYAEVTAKEALVQEAADALAEAQAALDAAMSAPEEAGSADVSSMEEEIATLEQQIAGLEDQMQAVADSFHDEMDELEIEEAYRQIDELLGEIASVQLQIEALQAQIVEEREGAFEAAANARQAAIEEALGKIEKAIEEFDAAAAALEEAQEALAAFDPEQLSLASDRDEEYTNTATYTFKGESDSDTADFKVKPLPVDGVKIEKYVRKDANDEWHKAIILPDYTGIFEYKIVVTNIGETDMENLQVVDEMLNFSSHIFNLKAGEAKTIDQGLVGNATNDEYSKTMLVHNKAVLLVDGEQSADSKALVIVPARPRPVLSVKKEVSIAGKGDWSGSIAFVSDEAQLVDFRITVYNWGTAGAYVLEYLEDIMDGAAFTGFDEITGEGFATAYNGAPGKVEVFIRGISVEPGSSVINTAIVHNEDGQDDESTATAIVNRPGVALLSVEKKVVGIDTVTSSTAVTFTFEIIVRNHSKYVGKVSLSDFVGGREDGYALEI